MSKVPAQLKYTKDHEWLEALEDGTARVGVTDHAQESLGDVTFVELPEVGSVFEAGDAFGVVESVKAASDLYMPVGGEIVEVNDRLSESPESVNQDPYGSAWMVRIRPSQGSDLESLLSAPDYEQLI